MHVVVALKLCEIMRNCVSCYLVHLCHFFGTLVQKVFNQVTDFKVKFNEEYHIFEMYLLKKFHRP